MKSAITILFFICTLAKSHGQLFHSEFEAKAFEADDPLQIILSSHPNVDELKFKEIISELNALESKLNSRKKNFKNEDRFLEWMFYYVHRKKLGWYENYVSFGDVFLDKKYDCLTGTILYAYLLDRMNYRYSIYEMDYHIFLVAHLPEKNVLLESTDPLEGYVNDSTQIQVRMEQFLSDGNKVIGFKGVGENDPQLQHSNNIRNVIDFKRLAGLQYFNLAVKAFTLEHHNQANWLIMKAEALYPSERIIGVKEVMLSSL